MRMPRQNSVSTIADTTEAIIIVGIVRNIASTMTKDMRRLASAFSQFEKIDWFVVESGSTDKSSELLEEISKRDFNFKFVGLTSDETLSRTENMALARNVYLDYLRRNDLFKKYRFVVIADFNNLNNRVDTSAVLSCFEQLSWDVVTANQSGKYYDIWALRHTIWSPNDCWEQHAFFRKYTKFPERAVTFSLRARMLKIPRDSEWINVDSAFGGLAIYKSSLFSSTAKYAGKTDSGKRICEHVPFHEALVASGAQIFINPRFVNTRSTDHSRRLSIMFTLARVVRYIFKINTRLKSRR